MTTQTIPTEVNDNLYTIPTEVDHILYTAFGHNSDSEEVIDVIVQALENTIANNPEIDLVHFVVELKKLTDV